MSITVNERWSGRRTKSKLGVGTAEVGYLIRGTDDDAAARTALLAAAPTTWSVDGSVLPRSGANVDQIGDQLWEGVVEYESSNYNPPETGQNAISFTTIGGTQHLTTSLAVMARYGDGFSSVGESAGDSIGATADEVKGTDVPAAQYAFEVSLYRAPEDVDETYIGHLYALTNKTNDASITLVVDGLTQTFAEGELIYLGARGSRRGKGDWEIVHSFAASPNVTLPDFGSDPVFTGVAKKGWEYVDVFYRADVVGTGANKRLVQIPKFVTVHKVFLDGDLTLLDIPSS